MTKLDEHIQETMQRDTDGTWSWENNKTPIIALGQDEIDAFIKANAGENIKLLPLQTWVRESETREYTQLNAGFINEKHHVPINNSVYKLNYTNNTDTIGTTRTPSVFVSPASGPDQIKPGEHYI